MIPKNNGKLLPRLMKLMGAILFSAFACPSIAAGGDLIVSNGRAESGEQVTFTLAVNEAPNAVQAFRMDFEYDFTVLRFREAVPGTLAGREFEIFRAFNQAPGVVRVGGVAPRSPGIKRGDSGGLISLIFEVQKSSDCELIVTELNNDIKNWRADSGRFEAIPAASSADAEEVQERSTEISEENSGQASAAVVSQEGNMTWAEDHAAANETGSGGGSDPEGNDKTDLASGEARNLSENFKSPTDLSPHNRTISFNPETRNQDELGVHEQSRAAGRDTGHQGAQVKMDNTAELTDQSQPPVPARLKNEKQEGNAGSNMAPVTESKPAFSGIAGPSLLNFFPATGNPSSPKIFKTAADLILQTAILVVLLLVLKEVKTRRKDGIYRSNHILAPPPEETSG